MNSSSNLEPIFYWIVRIGLWSLLFVPLLVTGQLFFPYVTGKNFFFRVVVEIITGAWLALAVLDHRYRPRRTMLLWTLVLFVSTLTLATIFGIDPYHSFWSNFERMEGLITHVHLLLLFLIASSMFPRKGEWHLLFRLSIGVSVLVALVGVFERFGVIMLGGSAGGSAGAGRIFSTLGNPIYLANYILFHLFLISYLFWQAYLRWRGGQRSYQWLLALYAVVFIFEGAVFIAAGTRGALLGLGAGIGMTLFLLAVFSERRTLRIGAVGGLMCGIGIVLLGLAARNTDVIQSYPLLARLSNISLSSSTVQSRFMVWGMAWDAFKARPLLGWGPENFIVPFAQYYNPNFYGNEPWFDRVHNMYLEWLVAAGILGFSAYLLLLGSVWWVMRKLWRMNTFDVPSLAILAGLFTAYLVQNLFVFDTIVSYIFFILLLAFLSSLRVYDNRYEEEKRRKRQTAPGGYQFGSFFLLLAGIGIALFINLRPLVAAAGIINTLDVIDRNGSVPEFLRAYGEVRRKETFGTREAQERLKEVALLYARSDHALPQESELLLSTALQEADALRERFPHVLRYELGQAKLLAARFLLFGNTRDRDQALRLFLRARSEAPTYPASSIGLAELYLSMGEVKKAEAVMGELYKNVTRPNALFFSAMGVYLHGGNFDEARCLAEEYIRMVPPRSDSHIGPEEAEFFTKKSLIAGNPAEREQFLLFLTENLYKDDNAVMFLARAETAAQLEKKEEAREYAERARSLAPHLGADIDRFLERL